MKRCRPMKSWFAQNQLMNLLFHVIAFGTVRKTVKKNPIYVPNVFCFKRYIVLRCGFSFRSTLAKGSGDTSQIDKRLLTHRSDRSISTSLLTKLWHLSKCSVSFSKDQSTIFGRPSASIIIKKQKTLTFNISSSHRSMSNSRSNISASSSEKEN